MPVCLPVNLSHIVLPHTHTNADDIDGPLVGHILRRELQVSAVTAAVLRDLMENRK